MNPPSPSRESVNPPARIPLNRPGRRRPTEPAEPQRSRESLLSDFTPVALLGRVSREEQLHHWRLLPAAARRVFAAIAHERNDSKVARGGFRPHQSDDPLGDNYISVCGEAVFAALYGVLDTCDFEPRSRGDAGFDCILDGVPIDVKATRDWARRHIVIYQHYLDRAADHPWMREHLIYVLVGMRRGPKGHLADVRGFMTARQLYAGAVDVAAAEGTQASKVAPGYLLGPMAHLTDRCRFALEESKTEWRARAAKDRRRNLKSERFWNVAEALGVAGYYREREAGR
jgi:hypothetical protein